MRTSEGQTDPPSCLQASHTQLYHLIQMKHFVLIKKIHKTEKIHKTKMCYNIDAGSRHYMVHTRWPKNSDYYLIVCIWKMPKSNFMISVNTKSQ